jgi:hypothetical protein
MHEGAGRQSQFDKCRNIGLDHGAKSEPGQIGEIFHGSYASMLTADGRILGGVIEACLQNKINFG